MAKRIRKRERTSAGLGSAALVSALAACVMCYTSASGNTGNSNVGNGVHLADSTGNLVKTRTGIEQSESLFVLDATPADLHGVMASVRAPRTGSGCAHWADPDSRAGILVPLPGTAWLLVGERGDEGRGTNEISIGNAQRKYPVIRFTQSGSPAVGEIVLTLHEADAEAERRCVERLRGIVVRWLKRVGDPNNVGGAGQMVVREVKFARAAVVGPAGDTVATGDTVVKLALVEGWPSMVYREMKEHRWGIIGGVVAGLLLMILTSIGGGILRRAGKLKVLDRSDREELVSEVERNGGTA